MPPCPLYLDTADLGQCHKVLFHAHTHAALKGGEGGVEG